ncbi:MAG: aromatic ring-hydroxylating dioxygenase subunit alpha [Kaiparowitsia implicata GSE-PSE-MK54-09C]|jgi:phenylpropionate dioxygenase-like ring-hydroxylating dioxygenase large terminal subunit|nr:aromatic ring-hydroxylating dioxygenase subunit alpha [Kaiparowitsia implicata GSE-PSE-MK54-09C]
MELATTLKGQTVQNRVREVGINPDHWYPAVWANQLKSGEVVPVTVWQQAIALYRDTAGQAHAMENACPHKGVELHQGKVSGDRLVCPYHGWEFTPDGNCARIPYLPADQKLPCAQARSYPVRERYGIVWVFPGDRALAESQPLPSVPEYDDPDCFMIPITGHFKAHFSICNENTMDVFHGFLHENLQGWYDPELLKLEDSAEHVRARYRVYYKGFITKVLGLSTDGGVTSRIVDIHYHYPHYHSSMEGVSSLYLMRLPVGPQETRSFSMLFLRLPVPRWLLNPVREPLMRFVREQFFMKFLRQDVEMMESEQRTYTRGDQRRYVEINPAIIALQRLIVRQFDQFMSQSSQPSPASGAAMRDDNSATPPAHEVRALAVDNSRA